MNDSITLLSTFVGVEGSPFKQYIALSAVKSEYRVHNSGWKGEGKYANVVGNSKYSTTFDDAYKDYVEAVKEETDKLVSKLRLRD